MSKAAHLAGKAINITTTTAPHAISYPITTCTGLQHGHAVALTLGYFFEINYKFNKNNITDIRGVEYLKGTMKELFHMFKVNSPEDCRIEWFSLMDSIGLEKIINMKLDEILNNIDATRLKNNPIEIDDIILSEVLKYILIK